MRKLFYVDLKMCGGDSLPEEFDLEEFCEVLQGKVAPDIEVVPLTATPAAAANRDGALVPQAVLLEALGEYCHR